MKSEKLQLKNRTWRKVKVYFFILVGVVLAVYLGFARNDISLVFWSLLNENTGAVQAISTMVLVGITAFYAIQVRKANELISMQIFPKIFIKPDKLYSTFLDTERMEKARNNILNSKDDEPYPLHFVLKYSVSNHSASSGSIGRPHLLIKGLHGDEKSLPPDLRVGVISHVDKGEIKDTLYLRAGETKNMEDEFFFYFVCNGENHEFIESAMSLQYAILYKDVVGDQISIPLMQDEVLPLQKMYDFRN